MCRNFLFVIKILQILITIFFSFFTANRCFEEHRNRDWYLRLWIENKKIKDLKWILQYKLGLCTCVKWLGNPSDWVFRTAAISWAAFQFLSNAKIVFAGCFSGDSSWRHWALSGVCPTFWESWHRSGEANASVFSKTKIGPVENIFLLSIAAFSVLRCFTCEIVENVVKKFFF